MAIFGGRGPSKGISGVKDPKKQIKNLSKKGYGFGSGKNKIIDNGAKGLGPLIDPPNGYPDGGNVGKYCAGCTGTASIDIEDVVL